MSNESTTTTDETEVSEQDYEEPEKAVYYAIEHADVPLTFEMIADRPETDGHSESEIRDGIDHWDFGTVEYDGVTAYYLGRETRRSVTIDREMYEEMRSKSFYIGEDPLGVKVHLTEDYRTVRRGGDWEDTGKNAWGPLFPIEDDDDVDQTEPKTEHRSKNVMLEAAADDIVQITTVHAGMRRVPEKMRVVRRTNTYYGPVVKLIPPEDWEGERTNYELTCPDHQSRLVLWKAVTDHEGYIQSWAKVARVSAEIFNVSAYDICGECGEPIKDPMHRSMAAMGQCPGGFNEGDGS